MNVEVEITAIRKDISRVLEKVEEVKQLHNESKQEVRDLRQEIKEFRVEIDDKFVSKTEFNPVRDRVGSIIDAFKGIAVSVSIAMVIGVIKVLADHNAL